MGLEEAEGPKYRNGYLIVQLDKAYQDGDDELLTYMADSGCTYFSLGIESGDDLMLKEMKKPLTLKILNKKAPLLEKHSTTTALPSHVHSAPKNRKPGQSQPERKVRMRLHNFIKARNPGEVQ